VTPLGGAFGNYYRAFGGIADSLRFVVRDSAAWARVWAELVSTTRSADGSPPPSAPAVDFRRELLLVAALGHRPTTGYRVEVANAAASADTLYVTVVRRAPDEHCVGMDAATYPVDIARLPRLDLPVRIIEREAPPACE